MSNYNIDFRQPADSDIITLVQENVTGTYKALKAFGLIKSKTEWRYATLEEEKQAAEQNIDQSPYIDYSDPGNPMFRHTVGDEWYEFTLRGMPEDTRLWLAQIVAKGLNDAYSRGRTSARAEIQTAIRNALML